MELEINNKLNILSFLFAVTAFLGLNPYFLWHGFNFIYFGFIVISTLVFFIALIKRNNKIRLSDLFVIFYIIVLIVFMYHRSLEALTKILIINISTFSFLLMSKKEKVIAFRYFTIIFALSLIPGLIMYILNLIHINLSWEYLTPDSGKAQSGYYYRQYLGSVILESPRNPIVGLYRFCGMYDEPGVVGTIAALLLAGNRFNMKKIWYKVIFTGGILSFSLAFYVLLIIYFALEFFISKRYKPAIVLTFVCSIILTFSAEMGDNSFIQNTIFNRLSFVNGTMVGNNRTNSLYDYEFNRFLNSGTKNLLIGVGEEERLSKPYMASASTYKNRIYDTGIIGFGLLVFLFVIFTSKQKNQYSFIYLLVFLASMYQRADVLRYSYIFIFVGSLYNLEMYISNKTNKSLI